MQTTDGGEKLTDDAEQQQQQQQRDDDTAKDDAVKNINDDNVDDGNRAEPSTGVNQPPEVTTAPRDTGHDRDQMLTR